MSTIVKKIQKKVDKEAEGAQFWKMKLLETQDWKIGFIDEWSPTKLSLDELKIENRQTEDWKKTMLEKYDGLEEIRNNMMKDFKIQITQQTEDWKTKMFDEWTQKLNTNIEEFSNQMKLFGEILNRQTEKDEKIKMKIISDDRLRDLIFYFTTGIICTLIFFLTVGVSIN